MAKLPDKPKASRNVPARKGKSATKDKPKKRFDTEDIEAVLETIVETVIEEGTPYGLFKRTAIKLRNKIVAEFIDKVDKLTTENIELVETIKQMSETGHIIVKVVKDQEKEIAQLKAKLKKLQNKQKKITPKK